MNSKLFLFGTAMAAIIATGPYAWAQSPAPPPPAPHTGVTPPPPPPPRAYSNQSSETRGIVQRFMLTPIGELDGLILADGTEVHCRRISPHSSRAPYGSATQ